MSSLSLRLPDFLHDKVRELSERENISMNQFIAMAVAEKMAALLTVDYLKERAERADDKILDRMLKRVPDVPPIRGDELLETLPSAGKRTARRAAKPSRISPHRAKR